MHDFLVALVSVLLFPAPAPGPAATPRPADMITQLRKALSASGWQHDVRAGPIALETQLLRFDASGALLERISDDTGLHTYSGTWLLQASATAPLLELRGDHLRIRGLYEVTLGPDGAWVELRPVAGGLPTRFTSTAAARLTR